MYGVRISGCETKFVSVQWCTKVCRTDKQNSMLTLNLTSYTCLYSVVQLCMHMPLIYWSEQSCAVDHLGLVVRILITVLRNFVVVSHYYNNMF